MKALIFAGIALFSMTALGQTSGFGAPTFPCAQGDTYQDQSYRGVSWKCGPGANNWAPTPAFQPYGTAGSSGITLSHVYASAGSFVFNHALNSVFYQAHCWTFSGGVYAPATWTDAPVDANDANVTVPSAGDYICSFNASGSFTPPAQDFSIAVSPNSQTYWPTMTGTQTTPAYTVTQSAIGGYTGTAAYTASGLASGMTALYTPSSITGAGTSSLTLSFPANQAPATTSFTVQGSDGINTHTANPSITVGNINSGLVECWPMTDGSGTAFADGCGTSNTETVVTGSLTWGTHTGLPGTTPAFPPATYTRGANQTATNFTGSTPFSVALWTSGCCTTTQGAFISTVDGSLNIGWEVGANISSGNISPYFYMNANPNGAILMNTSTSFSGSAVHYIVITYNGSKTAAGVVIYVDGNPIATTISANNLTGSIANTKAATIGARTDGTTLTTGAAISPIRIYNRVLSSSDVTNYFALGAR